MDILELIDTSLPVLSDKVEFYTVDPETLSFVKVGTDILGTNNLGKVIALYVITTEDIASLSITIQSSSNILSKVIEGQAILSDFSPLANNNSITLTSILQNTPRRISIMTSIVNKKWEEGEMELVWSYS